MRQVVRQPGNRLQLIVNGVFTLHAGHDLAVAPGLRGHGSEVHIRRVGPDLGAGHKSPLRYPIGNTEWKVRANIEPHVHQFQRRSGTGHGSQSLFAGDARTFQFLPHNDAQLGFDNRLAKVGTVKAASALEPTAGQQIGTDWGIETKHLSGGIGRETDLPAGELFARAQVSFQNCQLNPIGILKIQCLFQAGGRILPALDSVPQGFHRFVDIHYALLFCEI